MKIINASYEIITPITMDQIKIIEAAARTCYKSEGKITDNSATTFVKRLINNGHHAMLEFADMTVKFIVDRGISHELVRQRLCSFAQESTRYCNYGNDKGGITFIKPIFFATKSPEYICWQETMLEVEKSYNALLRMGRTPQEARSVLPNSTKAEINIKGNLREWRHILSIHACGTTGAPHPQMLEVMVPLLLELKTTIPVLFDDLKIPKEYIDNYVVF